MVSDGRRGIRPAVSPEVPHHPGLGHHLREAARPIGEADRHAEKELRKKVRGARGSGRRNKGRPAERLQGSFSVFPSVPYRLVFRTGTAKDKLPSGTRR